MLTKARGSCPLQPTPSISKGHLTHCVAQCGRTVILILGKRVIMKRRRGPGGCRHGSGKNGFQEAHQHCRRSSFLSLTAVIHRMQSSEHEAAPPCERWHHLYEPECGCENRFRSGWGFSKITFRPTVKNVIHQENAQNFLDLGGPLAQWVERASHVQRPCPRCSGPGVESWPGALRCMSSPPPPPPPSPPPLCLWCAV